jgi:hypothetical protein
LGPIRKRYVRLVGDRQPPTRLTDHLMKAKGPEGGVGRGKSSRQQVCDLVGEKHRPGRYGRVGQ